MNVAVLQIVVGFGLSGVVCYENAEDVLFVSTDKMAKSGVAQFTTRALRFQDVQAFNFGNPLNISVCSHLCFLKALSTVDTTKEAKQTGMQHASKWGLASLACLRAA